MNDTNITKKRLTQRPRTKQHALADKDFPNEQNRPLFAQERQNYWKLPNARHHQLARRARTANSCIQRGTLPKDFFDKTVKNVQTHLPIDNDGYGYENEIDLSCLDSGEINDEQSELIEMEDDPFVKNEESDVYSSGEESDVTSEETHNEALYPVIASLFPNTHSVIRFVHDGQKVLPFSKKYQKQLRWRASSITPNVVKRALRRAHFRMTVKYPDWLGYFGNHMKPTGFRPIKEFQKVNHFPGSFLIGRKDKLWINLCKFRTRFGRKSVDFLPKTFCLPNDLKLLKEVWMREEQNNSVCANFLLATPSNPRWIMKPPAAARGIGVRILRDWSEIPKQRQMVVQTYIDRPFLINGTKFDLRLYVYVSSFYPLKAYLHREGLVRFASEKYTNSISESANRFIHLTNYSINKKHKSVQNGTKTTKWKLESLWSHLMGRGVNVSTLWMRLREIVFKTLASVASQISVAVEHNCKNRASVHELFGFDILLDENVKPWLLEVNVSPSLHTNTKLDDDVKSQVITDMFNIAGFRLPPKRPQSQRLSRRNKTSANPKTSKSPMDDLSDTLSHHSSIKSASLTSAGSMRTCKSSNQINTDERSGSRNCGSSANAICNDYGINPHYPISESRLCETGLSANERNKHLHFQRLTNLNGLKPGESLDEFQAILDHLTPDDVRTLTAFIDERYRAALGNFEPIFPVGNRDGLQFLTFLEGCNGSGMVCMGSRSRSVRYYDLLLFTFLTFYGRNDCHAPTFYPSKVLDAATASQMPDYHVLTKGRLSQLAMERASKLTGVNAEGLLRLSQLCEHGFHLFESKTSDRPLTSIQKTESKSPMLSCTSVMSSKETRRSTPSFPPKIRYSSGKRFLGGDDILRAPSCTPEDDNASDNSMDIKAASGDETSYCRSSLATLVHASKFFANPGRNDEFAQLRSFGFVKDSNPVSRPTSRYLTLPLDSIKQKQKPKPVRVKNTKYHYSTFCRET